MTRAARISIELLAPPLLGASPFLLMAIVTGAFALIPVILLVAYLVAGLPSVVFALVLELAFWRGLEPRRPGAILLAGGLGLCAGIAIGLAPGAPTAAEKAAPLGLVGLVAGVGTALIVRWRTTRAAAGGP